MSDLDFSNFFDSVDEEHQKKEKAKAREMRQSQWWKNQKGRGECYYCKQRFHPSELSLDHVVPIVRGGKTSKSNVVPACKECNSKKKYMLPIEWQEHLETLAQEARATLEKDAGPGA